MKLLAALLVSLQLIAVHGPDGQRIEINAKQISSLREPRGEGHFDKSVRCLIFMANGKFIGVVETCEDVIKKLDAPPPK